MSYADGGRDRFRDLRVAFENGRRAVDKIREQQRTEQAREDFDFQTWAEAGYPLDWRGGQRIPRIEASLSSALIFRQ
ncbi:hypothetical protein [Halomicrobium salinisoli]|uniref:hypothetical protein n=1 Tax=Halomicrobium salinisoli TaxID=2878391 RepID=UPI001CEFD533|nr:hypothetical protein [Halomicrobium salinisoli]